MRAIPARSLTRLIEAYRKVAPNVRINATYAGVDDLQTSLRAQIGGGNAPDLFVVWPGNGSAMSVEQLGPAGVLADLSGESWIEPIAPNLRPMLSAGGKTYMYSAGVTPIAAIYNRKVFAAAGIATPPRTWGEPLGTTANVISTAGDATLSVADPSATNTGKLVNGTFALPQTLQANGTRPGGAAGAYAPVGGSASPTTLTTYSAPVSNELATVGFKQSIAANDALRTGAYSKTLTFTLSTTTP